MSITEGEVARFKCESSKEGKPVWKRNGREVKEEERIRYQTLGNCHSLTIKDALIEDEGTYTCEIKGESTSAKLSVKELSVEILSALKDQYVKEGQTAEFVLQTTKKTENYHWYKEDREIRKFDARYKISTEGSKIILTILEAEMGDATFFKCSIGDHVTSAKLHVEGLKKGRVREAGVVLRCSKSDSHNISLCVTILFITLCLSVS